MAIPRLHVDHTAVLIIDVQERLLPAIHNAEQVVRQCGRLIDGANVLNLPVLVTEQYRKGLGATAGELAEGLKSAVCCHEKLKFSASIEPIRDELASRSIRSVLVAGIEAHVCVLQTCLDLAEAGYVVAVAIDAIGSRHPEDQAAAVLRLVQAGVVPTSVESALLEMVHEAGTGRFKAILPVIK